MSISAGSSKIKKEDIKPGFPPGYGKSEFEGETFLEMLANATNAKKAVLVRDLLKSIREGHADATVWRMIEKALVDSKPKDEKNKPIPILGGVTQDNQSIKLNNPNN